MKTIKINLYAYDELTDDAKEKALERFADINVSDELWYEHMMEESKDLGFDITSFDIDRGSITLGKFTESFEEIAKRIIANHGEKCDTYIDATNYLKDLAEIISAHDEDTVDEFERAKDALDEAYERALAIEYLSMLKHEYDYQTSREAVEETIMCNDYQFTEDGELYR